MGNIKKAHANWVDNVCTKLVELIKVERNNNNGVSFAIINDKHAKNVKRMSNDLAKMLGLIIQSFFSGGLNDQDVKRLNHIFKDANSGPTFKVENGARQELSDEEKYIDIISRLRALGFNREEIENGINALDENKYKEFNVDEVFADIVKNITTAKEQARKLN